MSKMASNGTPCSRLGPHRSQPSASVDLPMIGTRVSFSGTNLRLKDSLMRTFVATWKQARIEGVVVGKPKKNCRQIKWTIVSETCVSDHSVAFWKKLSQQQVVTPPVTSPDIAAFPDGLRGEEESDEHHHERTLLEDEPDELDVSEAISTLGQGVTAGSIVCPLSGHYSKVV